MNPDRAGDDHGWKDRSSQLSQIPKMDYPQHRDDDDSVSSACGCPGCQAWNDAVAEDDHDHGKAVAKDDSGDNDITVGKEPRKRVEADDDATLCSNKRRKVETPPKEIRLVDASDESDRENDNPVTESARRIVAFMREQAVKFNLNESELLDKVCAHVVFGH